MRKLKNILISGILSVCMVVTSLPIELLAQEVNTVQDDNGNEIQEDTQDKVQYEIISFEELPESVKNQNASLGTGIEELELPETLTASYRFFKEKSGDEKAPEDNTGGKDGEKEPEENTGNKNDEKEPEDNTVDEDKGKNPGTGDNENEQEGTSEGEGNDNESEGNSEVGDSSQTPDEKLETENGNQMTEYASETKDGKSEAEPAVSETEDAGKAEPTVKQETVEVHMKEYNAQPEDRDVPKTLVSESSETSTELSGESEINANSGTYLNTETETNEDSDSGLSEETKPESGSDANLSDETSSEADTNKDKNEGNVQEYSTETIVIEKITWISTPAYDGDVEGSYTFTPVITGDYVLAEGVALPEIIITVGEEEEPEFSEEAEEPAKDISETPGCVVISEDTTWGSGTLYNGTLTVEEGVTLKITGIIQISGDVTINGGGTIERISENAYFNVASGTKLTVGKIIIDGKDRVSSLPMIQCLKNGNITLDDGCHIKNMNINRTFVFGGGSAIWIDNDTTLILNDALIENCVSRGYGGAIGTRLSSVIINSGTYRNNRTTGIEMGSLLRYGGGFLYSVSSEVMIYGGRFLDNTSSGEGGGIFVAGSSEEKMYLYGGYFEGNKSTYIPYSGSGALFYNANGGGNQETYDSIFNLSGHTQFCGDGINGSGTDGIAFDINKNISIYRKILLSSQQIYPVDIYLKASEGYVIAEGADGYELQEWDMKKISFHDTGNSGKDWYAVLDKDNNQIKLSVNRPEYMDKFFVRYISNGAEGYVIDDNGYELGDTTEVKSADGLRWEEHEFVEWNTKADGAGESYYPGDNLTITDDIDLYAIFRESQGLEATFYSGGANRREIKSANFVEGANTVKITAPKLKDMGDWIKLGWNASKDSYTIEIAAGTEFEISDNTFYYGIYERNVTLSYDSNGANAENNAPPSENVICLANVHEDITYETDGVEVAGEITADNSGWEFAGWNTEPDGTGDLYREGDIIKISEDTTLYATFEAPPYACFYSGSAGEYELKKTNVVTKKLIVPPLKEMSGWDEIGWDKDNDGYEGSIKQGTVLELACDTDYYGVYKKEVTLSYSTLHNESGSIVVLSSSKQTRCAKVHKEEITYEPVSANPDSFEFDIAPDVSYGGYEFIGWNTREDGTGTFYKAGDTDRNKISITQDTVLYAIFRIAPVATFYSGDAGQHKTIKGEFNYSINATVTAPDLEEMDGWEPVGWSTDETGYSGSIEAGDTISLSEDTSYYGIYRKSVELSYDTGVWGAVNPEKQSSFGYANVHDDITCTSVRFDTAPAITRVGYSFVGWSNSRNVDESSHIYGPDESIELEDSVTLFAQMKDDIAPVLGEASYNSGYNDIGNWLVRKKDLVITVPITEEGSGVNKIVYTLTPEKGDPVTGEALMGEAYVPRQVRQSAVVQLDVAYREMNVSSRRTDVNTDIVDGQGVASDNQSGAAAQDTTAGGQSGTKDGQVGTTDGQIQARITISEDYKGTVTLKCLDNAGNESPDKLLTAAGGGVIVEDNAPQINFTKKDIKNSEAVVTVSVSDDVDTDKNSRITGGIAGITYQIDNKQAQNITTKNFDKEIVSSCEFNVDISGSGEHTLKVTATDNAGNESQKSTQVSIEAENKKTTVIKQKSNPPAEDKNKFVPLVKEDETEQSNDSEPATGDNSMRVEVYATIAMIAGLLYVLLYFITGSNGMTEEDKNETVSRILNWAKKGGSCRRFIAIAAIFCVLFYYHSIGKRINVEWKEATGVLRLRSNSQVGINMEV